MNSKSYIIRADASISSGTGHLMRCVSLAQSLKDAGGEVTFAVSESPENTLKKIKSEFAAVKIKSEPGTGSDAAETIEKALAVNSKWVVTDGYHFDSKYQESIKAAGLKLLFFDDYGHCDKYSADIVLNQNSYASEKYYPNPDIFTRLLLGTKYSSLRREFLKYRSFKRETSETATKVLVTMGGSDPLNTTLKVLNSIKKITKRQLETKIVVGGANPHLNSIEKEISKYPNIQILKNVSNMPELMAWGDLAVSGGGTTCWEICLMKLPNMILYCADNQVPIAESLDKAGAAVNIGRASEISEQSISEKIEKLLCDSRRREAMSEESGKLVDGLGAERVAEEMSAPFLRHVLESDCDFVYGLSNSAEVRAISFSKDPIPWETHLKWFPGILKDKNSAFYIAEDCNGNPIGQIRFKKDSNEAVVSVSLVKGVRGKGYGSRIIAQGTEALFRSSDVNIVHAYVKKENPASARSFEKSGFAGAAKDKYSEENNSLHLIRRRK
ncbi:MAG: UDP-2,4-diacetamido-2,4,6-trideoxy-beta-L-altropyranose hydrolase [Lentisphaerae bacterium]|nr:UDP-2,4-diacetamido-2,4,6-trideoxy-beta-L-altropyranose hydrolase [Lentisphaerota bacterium]